MRAEQTLPVLPSVQPGIAALAITAAALGYFVDVFDILLFNVVRVPSLTALGVVQANQLATGVMLFNFQMGGMLLGGIAFGIWGDRRGRRSVLFASILLYSLGNLANAWVQTVPAYAMARFVAGVGLAGELGAGVTLVCELLPRDKRGYGTALVAAVGILGGVAAPLVGEHLPWRTAYVVGGVLGLLLLGLRATVPESAMYRATEKGTSRRGDLVLLFASRERAMRFVRALLVGLPLWYAIGILAALAPEVGRALGITPGPTAPRAIFYAYIGLTIGDLASGLLSQWFRTRKWVMAGFLALDVLAIGLVLTARSTTAGHYYSLCALLGVANGYWALFITNAAEQFGTNLRATVATAVPNLIRGSTILISLLFVYLKEPLGVVGSAVLVGGLCLGIALLSILGSQETFGKDLDYVET
jgi:MFS transporter, putative metabolite:H+ symporter